MKKQDLSFLPEFYDRYINLVVNDTDLIEGLIASTNDLDNCKADLIRLQNYRYQEGKWTCKELVQHIVDTERIMSYRALSIARGETKNLPGFNQDDYVLNSYSSVTTMESLLEEFKWLRKSTILLFKSFNKEMLINTGLCSNIKMTPLAIGFVCIGHVQHHVAILKERYFDHVG